MINWGQLGFQDANSVLIEIHVFFYDFIILILTVIIILVGILIVFRLKNKVVEVNLLENQLLEIIWTILPGLILILIALPSLRLLYLLEESYSSEVTIKVTGLQWYWSYEIFNESKLNSIEWDSYILPESAEGSFRLLDVDNRTILPFFTNIRLLVTSSDVLHSWTIPRLGVKADATPGRLNQITLTRIRPGLIYGQCSEICGANHRFMPIVLEFINTSDWVYYFLNNSTT